MNKLLLVALLGTALPLPAQAQAPAPTVEAAPIDPAQLALARSIILKISPDGTYRKLMQGTMDQVMNGMTHQMMSIPVRQFLSGTSVPPEQIARLGNTTIRDIMTLVDPAFDERSRIGMSKTMAVLTDVLASFEPQMREGMAEAYARNFTPAQLADIGRFFSTPAGQAYASRVMTIMTDPAVRKRMEQLLPAIAQAMPKAIQQAEEATASLPKPKKYEDLSDTDRAQLAKLIGVDPAELKKVKSQ